MISAMNRRIENGGCKDVNEMTGVESATSAPISYGAVISQWSE